MIKKIKALANIDNQFIQCYGTLEIKLLEISHIFVSWNLLYNDILVASKSRKYFRNNINDESDFIKIILNDIEKYRIERKQIFKEITVYE
ncbi:MAG TPA: hypothetical protein PLE30_11280 [Candidatus Kapabacteria bacterium]|nr:hypothetical protein [Candidatus Kapabacteria bacterium]